MRQQRSGVPATVNGQIFAIDEGSVGMSQESGSCGDLPDLAKASDARQLDHDLMFSRSWLRAQISVNWAGLDAIYRYAVWTKFPRRVVCRSV